MRFFKPLIFALLLLLGTACPTVAPTPILMHQAKSLNSEVVQLYMACSEGANYVPDKEGCDPDLLSLKVDELRALSLNFIAADIKQPQGYDFYLATSMIYFRIAQRNMNDYTQAEQIARQFFEVQKATGGHSIDTARFYWAWFASSAASKQYYEDPFALTPSRKADLLLALGEGTSLLDKLDGPRLVRLQQALQVLQFVIDSIQ